METAIVENPTLQLVKSDKVQTISELEEAYPETWMLIEVTREDLWQIYEGKLLALADDPAEFVNLKKSLKLDQIVNLTTRGVSIGDQSAIWTKL